MKIVSFLKRNYYIFLFFFIIGVISLGSSPLFHPVPHTDSGVFLYGGKQFLAGDILYKDFWDHKGPFIYLINAIGLLIDSDSLWGIWIVESTILFFASLTSYIFFEELFGKLVAFLSTSFWLTFFTLIRALNYTENYYIFIQFLILYLFIKGEKAKNRKITDFFIGIVSGIGFLIRPNMIGVALSVGAIWVWSLLVDKKLRLFFQKFIFAILGAFSIFGIVFFYFYINDAIPDFINQVFLFNFQYAGEINTSLISFFEYGNNNIDFILPFGFAGWLTVLVVLISNASKEFNIKKTILILFLLCLPLEIYLSTLSGYKFIHYFVPWLVPIALLVGFLFSVIYENLPKNELLKTKVTMRQALLIVMFLGFISFTLIEHYAYLKSTAYWCIKKKQSCTIRYDEATIEILDYLELNTSPDDSVYFWGLELKYNFLGNRKTMGRYWNPRIFNNSTYLEDGIIELFENDILAIQPIIIDTSPQYDFIIPLFSGYSGFEGINHLQDFLRANYEKIGIFESNGWIIYEFQDN